MLKRIATFAAAGLLAAASVSATVVAEDEMMDMPDVSMMSVDEIIDLRVDTMRSNGMTMRGAGGLSGDEAVAAAETLKHNAQLLKLLFPEGSGEGTKALDNIWTDWDNFVAILDGMEENAMAMADAAAAGDADAYGAAMQAIGGACGMCHSTYRAQ